MGRYYYSNNSGDEGKFWFAVQPSVDVETVYGMTMEEKPSDMTGEDEEEWEGYGEWWADYRTSDSEYVRKQLDKQYDILGVPQEERIYEYEDEWDKETLTGRDGRGKYVWETILKYFLTEQKIDGAIGYAMGDKDQHKSMYPISKEKELAASRIDLGLFILHDIQNYGECSMNMEF